MTCVTETSQLQALDRSQPSLPVRPDGAGPRTHDYNWHGAISLLAAINAACGKLLSLCQQRHRREEWVTFVILISVATLRAKELDLILANYSAHKRPKVRRWLEELPRFDLQHTPTGSSLPPLVEQVFRDRTEDQRRRGVFPSVRELVYAHDQFLGQQNAMPKPFIRTAKANELLATLIRS